MRTMRAVAWVAPAFLLLPWWFGCGGDVPPPEPVIRPVRSTVVQEAGAARVRTFVGVARAGVESSLSFRVGGTVDEVAVAVGDVVDKGQLIARVTTTDFELKLQQAQASLAQAQAAARNASSTFDRVRGLYENNNASKSDYDGARAAAESAQAQVSAAEKQVALARQQLGYARLTAPVHGTVASVDIETNENVQPGQRVILLTSGDLPEVEITVPEATIGDIRAGQTVTVRYDALPERSFAGTITEVGVATTRTATTYPVVIRMDQASPDVRPGMAAEVDIAFESRAAQERIRVPSVAVGEDRRGRFVMVLKEAAGGLATAQRRPVTVGHVDADGIEIREGLTPGERIATAGVQRIEEGMTVRLMEDER